MRDKETHLIPMMALQLRRVRRRLRDTPDRTAMRDYIHVPDLAAAHVAPLKLLEEGSAGGFNLGTGSGFSVREVLTGMRSPT
ncbi:NAD-dependent epimerase/dehydratase family protein [Bradyrhizobium sp. BWC-3-1]|uniref:NAD-dependent epimerase/dehydratase family protein n=1 Tax=Bradyrhizobium sp. BWC-3-1 TaxID=3080012 RepID=UPI00293E391B|nr:NAD-dependent epimerase/dehydratase family protein [Bradyrhizobium sp. BWC-3-1]WOH60245.1 NAD-dependent epimerase/dehydratase family protein [Bradyrhizobium sp. BWC-3-1]